MHVTRVTEKAGDNIFLVPLDHELEPKVTCVAIDVQQHLVVLLEVVLASFLRGHTPFARDALSPYVQDKRGSSAVGIRPDAKSNSVDCVVENI